MQKNWNLYIPPKEEHEKHSFAWSILMQELYGKL
jgi:hypothetical protein